jgi:hypothetical protein
LWSFAEVHEVIHAKETLQPTGVISSTAESRPTSEVTSAAAEVGGDPTVVVEVELMIC